MDMQERELAHRLVTISIDTEEVCFSTMFSLPRRSKILSKPCQVHIEVHWNHALIRGFQVTAGDHQRSVRSRCHVQGELYGALLTTAQEKIIHSTDVTKICTLGCQSYTTKFIVAWRCSYQALHKSQPKSSQVWFSPKMRNLWNYNNSHIWLPILTTPCILTSEFSQKALHNQSLQKSGFCEWRET